MAVTALPIAVQAPSAAAATSARRGSRLRAAVVAPRPRLLTSSSSSHHRRHTAGGNRVIPSSSSSSPAATAPAHEDEEQCEEGDVECTWDQLEREVAEESVAKIMARDVMVCHPDDSVLAALELLVEQRLSGRGRGDSLFHEREKEGKGVLFGGGRERQRGILFRNADKYCTRRCRRRPVASAQRWRHHPQPEHQRGLFTAYKVYNYSDEKQKYLRSIYTFILYTPGERAGLTAFFFFS